MDVILLIAHDACHSVGVGPHSSNHHLNYCSYIQCYHDYLMYLIFIVNVLLLFVICFPGSMLSTSVCSLSTFVVMTGVYSAVHRW